MIHMLLVLCYFILDIVFVCAEVLSKYMYNSQFGLIMPWFSYKWLKCVMCIIFMNEI